MNFRLILVAVLAVLLAACGKGLEKAPKCKGTYEPVNSPEHYLKGQPL
ncbi:hypothetical protein [Dyella sp.]